MQKVHIRLFGRFRVTRGQRSLPGLEARKVQELLSYLLLNREVPHAREYLASLLWISGTTKQQRTYLRKALWQLQEALSDLAPVGECVMMQVEPDWVQLRLGEQAWLDVATLEQVYASVTSLPGGALQEAQARTLHDAVELYSGELLEGWYHDWCLCERERLQHEYLALLDKLIDYCEAHRHFEDGVEYGFRILQHDRAHERTHRKLMRLCYLAGDRTGALRQYERCRAALAEELKVEPRAITQDLYRRIQDDALVANSSAGRPAAAAPTREALADARRHLAQIGVFLTELDASPQPPSAIHKDDATA